MELIIRFCKCGRVLSTQDIQEGRPCKVCRDKMAKVGIVIPPLDKQDRKPNPAKNVWGEKAGGLISPAETATVAKIYAGESYQGD